jgi:TRAP-type C4-dicarboxylate transport system permease large subunit
MLIIGSYLVIGLFMDAVPAIIIMLPIVQPLAESVGINQIHLGVGSVAALAIGLITPPYGLCLLLASDLADIPIVDTLKTTFLFTLVMISILFVIGALPDTVMLIPKLTLPYVK